jgi:TRAP-type mannitol/chloroaromatic compound transport system permease small subunit
MKGIIQIVLMVLFLIGILLITIYANWQVALGVFLVGFAAGTRFED